MSKIDRLFELRAAERMGTLDDMDRSELDELSTFGETMGVTRRGGSKPMAETAPKQQEAMMPTKQGTGIPSLDTLQGMNRKQPTGLVHNRTLGRVTKEGM